MGIFTSTDSSDVYWNSYSYCGGDPLNLIDYDGSAGEQVVMAPMQVAEFTRWVEYAAEQLRSWGMSAGSAAEASVWLDVFIKTAEAGIEIGHAVSYATFLKEAVYEPSPMNPTDIVNSQSYQDFLNNQQMSSGQAEMANAQAGGTAQSGSMGADAGGAQGGDPNKFDFDKNGKIKGSSSQDVNFPLPSHRI